VSAGASADLERLESLLGHRFSDRSVLERALVHGSLGTESGAPNNETLEFLGDAVLDLAISESLMRDDPDLDEGRLSRIRAALVKADSLARVAEALALGEFVKLGRGEELSGGRRKASILSACYEAVVAAIFVDAGYEAARDAVVRHLAPRFAEARSDADYKTRLQELTQARFKTTPTYRLVETSGPAHARCYHAEVAVGDEALGAGVGPSRKSAEQLAARQALAKLEDD
jgi:ribonuclease III